MSPSTKRVALNRMAAPKVPKYWRLVEHFRAQIESGELVPGDRLPSLAEMKEQGVSRPVMEKVHQILESEHIIIRQPGSGTFVCPPKKREATGIFGVCGYGFGFTNQSSYWNTLVGSLREAAAEHDFQLLLLDYDSTRGWEKADGVLLLDWSANETLRHVPTEIPCVSIMVRIEGMASVYADDYSGARAATEYLIDQGHSRIAYLHGRDHTVALQRITGYKDALKNAAIKPFKSWMRKLQGGIDYGEQFIEAGHDAMNQWLDEDWKSLGCTALLAHNDETAIGVLAALREAEISVPEQVSVIGFDGLQIGDYVAPRLTTVEVPLREIGARAVEMLRAQIVADVPGGESEVLPMKLRVRESVAPRASS